MSDPNPQKENDRASDGINNQTPNESADQPPTSAPVSRQAAPWRAWDRIRRAMDVNSTLTLIALILALFLGIYNLWATSENLRQSNMAMIYSFGFEITKSREEHAKLAKFFDKGHRRPMTDQELWDEFKKLPEEEQTLIYLGCERMADFSEIAFFQREALPADDWDTWWSYIVDQYDESPICRDFLSKRPTWYAFLDAVKLDNRGKYYRGNQRR